MSQEHLRNGLEIQPDGRLSQPVFGIRLDPWCDASEADVARAAKEVLGSLQLSIGILTRLPPSSLTPLLDSLTLTLAVPDVVENLPQLVPVADPESAYEELVATVGRRPQSAVALGHLLRETESLGTVAGLAAEASTYSMLLGGGEFAEWLSARGASRPAPPPEGPLLQVDREGGRLSIVLSNPERHNAFSFRMREDLFDALELAVLDDTIEEVELSGAGRSFCSGGDLAEFGTAQDLVAAYYVRLDRAPWRLLDQLRDRVTIRVHGATVGAGAEMAAFAGRVVSSPETFFLLPELEMGLVPGAGGTVSIARRIGRWRAAWMILTSARLDPITALHWGLIDKIEHHDR